MSLTVAEAAEAIYLAKFIDGPALVGIFLNVMLYGVMVTQTFFYYSNFTRDPKWIKYYVGLLLFADTLNTIFNIWWIYNVLINQFGSLQGVTVANWLFETEESMAGLIGMQVQLFYAWRILKLTGNKWLTAVICTFSVIGCLAGIGTSINVAIKPLFVNFEHYKEVVILWLAAAAFTDVIIALSLTWHLHKHRTGHVWTDTVVSRIIQITMSNGLITASFALADIIAFVSTNGGLHLAFNYTLCKLYGNSVMSSLNSRPISSKTGNASFGTNSSRGQTTNMSTLGGNSQPKRTRATVMVSVETHEMTDVPGHKMNVDEEWADDHESQGSATKGSAV